MKKVKKGDDSSHKGKNFAYGFWKLYASCNHTNLTSCFDKNCKWRSQIPFLWKIIISLTEMLTLTENLALLRERIKFLTSSCSNRYHITFSSFFCRHNLFNTASKRCVHDFFLKKVCSSWDVLENKKDLVSVSRFFFSSKYLKSYNFCRSRKQMLNICIWVFVLFASY